MKFHRHEKPRATNWRSARGQAQVEFAFVIVVLMILCLGSVELISLIHAYNVLADAAKEGVRYAIVHGDNNSTPAGPVCPCTDIDGPAAPVGTLGGNGTGYGVVKTYARYALHDISSLTVTTTYIVSSRKPPNRVREALEQEIGPAAEITLHCARSHTDERGEQREHEAE